MRKIAIISNMKLRCLIIMFWVTLLSVSNPCRAVAYNARIPRIQDDFENDVLSTVPKKSVAHLLVDKRISNKFLVKSMDVVVQYRIFNVGTEVATEVHLRDPELEDASKFQLVAGLTDAHFGRILVGNNASHTVIVRPIQSGPHNFTAAKITYRSVNEEMTIVGTSSEPGTTIIHSSTAFHRQISAHFEEWTAFAFLALPSLVIPYMLWFTSQSTYEKLVMELGGGRRKKMYFLRDR